MTATNKRKTMDRGDEDHGNEIPTKGDNNGDTTVAYFSSIISKLVRSPPPISPHTEIGRASCED